MPLFDGDDPWGWVYVRGGPLGGPPMPSVRDAGPATWIELTGAVSTVLGGVTAAWLRVCCCCSRPLCGACSECVWERLLRFCVDSQLNLRLCAWLYVRVCGCVCVCVCGCAAQPSCNGANFVAAACTVHASAGRPIGSVSNSPGPDDPPGHACDPTMHRLWS